MYGQRAKELLQEISRAGLEFPSYSDEGVRQVLKETSDLHGEVERVLRENPNGIDDTGTKATLVVHDASMHRNQRCLLAYHMARCDRIEQLRWQHGTVLAQPFREKMSTSESDYFKAYSTTLTRYMSELGLDLTADRTPPKAHQILVRAQRDCGSVMTSRGATELRKDQSIKMFAIDAEALIRKGWIKQIDEREN